MSGDPAAVPTMQVFGFNVASLDLDFKIISLVSKVDNDRRPNTRSILERLHNS